VRYVLRPLSPHTGMEIEQNGGSLDLGNGGAYLILSSEIALSLFIVVDITRVAPHPLCQHAR
jgi:hypothetical protein